MAFFERPEAPVANEHVPRTSYLYSFDFYSFDFIDLNSNFEAKTPQEELKEGELEEKVVEEADNAPVRYFTGACVLDPTIPFYEIPRVPFDSSE